jgi:hypothetical protein
VIKLLAFDAKNNMEFLDEKYRQNLKNSMKSCAVFQPLPRTKILKNIFISDLPRAKTHGNFHA